MLYLQWFLRAFGYGNVRQLLLLLFLRIFTMATVQRILVKVLEQSILKHSENLIPQL